MQIIGITGGSGAGKSEVCRLIGERGIPIFDADREYARIAAPNSPCVHEIAQTFGDGVIAPDGSLRRRELGAIVFAEGAEEKRRLLNGITHRYVCAAADAWLRECEARGERCAVIDAPLLIESGLDGRCDRVVFVTADRQTRIDRIMRRDGISAERAAARIDAQHDDAFFRAHCDTVIENGRGAELSGAVDALLGGCGAAPDGSSANNGTQGMRTPNTDSQDSGGACDSGHNGNCGNNQAGGSTHGSHDGSARKGDDRPAEPERHGVLARYPLPRRTPARIAIASVLIVLALTAIINLAVRSPELIDNVTHPILYAELIDEYSGEYGVPPEIICAVIETESSFRADAVSGAGAIGLMQITRETFWWLLTKAGEDMDVDRLYDPEINIRYGTYFLSLLYEEFGDWDTVCAAYNAGRSRVHGWLDDPDITKDGKLVNIPITETAEYVVKVRKSAEKYTAAWARQAEQLHSGAEQ